MRGETCHGSLPVSDLGMPVPTPSTRSLLCTSTPVGCPLMGKEANQATICILGSRLSPISLKSHKVVQDVNNLFSATLISQVLSKELGGETNFDITDIKHCFSQISLQTYTISKFNSNFILPLFLRTFHKNTHFSLHQCCGVCNQLALGS